MVLVCVWQTRDFRIESFNPAMVSVCLTNPPVLGLSLWILDVLVSDKSVFRIESSILQRLRFWLVSDKPGVFG